MRIGVKMTFRNGDMCQRNRPQEGTTFIAPKDTVYLFRCAQTNPGSLFGKHTKHKTQNTSHIAQPISINVSFFFHVVLSI